MAFCLSFAVTLALMGSGLAQVFSNRADFKLSTRESNCSESCGEALIKYPFYTKSRACGRDGFKLECYNNSTLKMEIGKRLYNVTAILNNGIILDIIHPNCSPNLEIFRIERNQNFAISKDNFIQFSSCNNRTTCKLKNCNLPYANVIQCNVVNPCCFSLVYDQTWVPGVTNFDRFSEWQCSKFISWGFPGGTNYTSIVGLKLEWGIPGDCKSVPCHKHARCEAAKDVKDSVRCTCKGGYEGDGFIEGTGCIEVCSKGGKTLYGKDCKDDSNRIRKAILGAGITSNPGTMIAILKF
ncbi:probably inactive receptor-like protein kinase At2g46850 [Cryptomeria japonica]|uniref:probably inactive receptor-like protein kinase At2g46850 n=1 Tax=Cryptomeria japonica TaxID=3369 RepID=UPI0027DA055E|nr:probably inactive receptor-like protein kinase At2g46850 [Cryptomeria japonica]